MLKVQKLMQCAAFAAIASLVIAQAHAQATRTWVSGVGDDANPCSRTAPCKTFAGAISKTAAGGEINAIDAGGFGVVTINKAITINGDGTMAGVLGAGTNGININAGAGDAVTLRSIEIEGGGTGINGINFIAGGQLTVEKVQVYGFSGHGILFPPAGASRLVVNDSTIRNNGGSGIHVAGSGNATVTLNNVTVIGNARGVRAEDGSKVFVHGSVSASNVGNGFIANGTSRSVDMTIESSSSFNNGGAGVFSGPLSTVRISRVSASGNSTGLLPSGGGAIISTGTNAVFGNATDGAPTSTGGAM